MCNWQQLEQRLTTDQIAKNKLSVVNGKTNIFTVLSSPQTQGKLQKKKSSKGYQSQKSGKMDEKVSCEHRKTVKFKASWTLWMPAQGPNKIKPIDTEMWGGAWILPLAEVLKTVAEQLSFFRAMVPGRLILLR